MELNFPNFDPRTELTNFSSKYLNSLENMNRYSLVGKIYVPATNVYFSSGDTNVYDIKITGFTHTGACKADNLRYNQQDFDDFIGWKMGKEPIQNPENSVRLSFFLGKPGTSQDITRLLKSGDQVALRGTIMNATGKSFSSNYITVDSSQNIYLSKGTRNTWESANWFKIYFVQFSSPSGPMFGFYLTDISGNIVRYGAKSECEGNMFVDSANIPASQVFLFDPASNPIPIGPIPIGPIPIGPIPIGPIPIGPIPIPGPSPSPIPGPTPIPIPRPKIDNKTMWIIIGVSSAVVLLILILFIFFYRRRYSKRS